MPECGSSRAASARSSITRPQPVIRGSARQGRGGCPELTVIRTEVSLSTVRVGYLPAKDVVADSNILGRELTFEAVLGPTAIAVAGDFVAVESHESTLIDRLSVE